MMGNTKICIMKNHIKFLAIVTGAVFSIFSCKNLEEFVPETKSFVSFVNETVSAPASESMLTVAVRTSCDWSASSPDSWIQVVPGEGTSATTKLSLLVSENTVVETPRSGQVTLTGPGGVSATLTVNQAGPAGPIPPGTEIYTAEDVKTFLEVAENFGPTTVTTVYNDIDMDGATLSPLASYAGVLEGNGHKIYNFKVESQAGTTGLILMNTGTIRNLVFGSSDGVKYDGVSEIAAAEGKGGSHTGLIAVNAGTVENVKTFATVRFEAQDSATESFGVAGLVGSATADGEQVSIIRKCSNYALIEAAGKPVPQTGFAGVVGYVGAPGTLVESCTNEADIAISVTVGIAVHIGGVIGRSDAAGTYDKLVNNREISYTQKEKPSAVMGIGGVVGGLFNGGTISGAVNNGDISSDLLRGNRIGGILGTLKTGGAVIGSTNNGKVILTQGACTNYNAMGGIVGLQEESTTNDKDNIIRDCTNNGDVLMTVENTTKNVYMNSAGGILGVGTMELSVTGNTNNGNITAVNTATSAVYAGGIIGSLMNQPTECEITGNVNTGAVHAETSNNKNATAGGVVGYIAGTSGSDANKVVLTLKGEKSTGAITCGNAEAAGAIAGKNGSAILQDCIVGGSVNGTALTEANFESLVQGSASKGTATGTALDGAEPSGPADPGTVLKTAEDVKAFLELAPSFTEQVITKVYNDIDMGGATLAPVNTYAGILDGQGHKIYNFKVESQAGTTGLFLLNTGTIKNLVFGSSDGVKYDGISEIAAAAGKGGSSTGLIAVNAGKVENVKTFATIKFEAQASATETFGVGGLVGTATVDGEAVSTIRNCTNYALIEAVGKPAPQTGFGGILGYAAAPGTIVESCTNEAVIDISVTINLAVHVGGVIGRSEAAGTYDKLVNNKDISYTQKEKPSAILGIGGVVGGLFNGGTISGSVNNGTVSSNLVRGNRVGGVLGTMKTGGEVIGSINNGNVIITQAACTNYNTIGGIVAFQEESATNDKDNIIRDCTNNGNVSMTVENTTKNVYMNSIGGILGLGTMELSVTGNTNNGNIVAVNTATSAVYAGGIFGSLMNLPTESEFSGNVNTGAVSASTSNNANVACGGVAGYIAGSSGSDANKVTLTLSGEKSTGAVTCGRADASGAIAGNNGSANLQNCIAGGSVNGETLTEANVESLVQGSVSKGSATGTKLAK